MMVMMTMKKKIVILTNHIACHSRSEGKPQGQCNQVFQLKRINSLTKKVAGNEIPEKNQLEQDNDINDDDLMFDDATC